MANIPAPLVYDEPTVMWRMQRRGQSTHAVIGRRPGGAVVVWFVNNRPVGSRSFSDCSSAFRWTEQMKDQNWAVGWRLSSAGDNRAESGEREVSWS